MANPSQPVYSLQPAQSTPLNTRARTQPLSVHDPYSQPANQTLTHWITQAFYLTAKDRRNFSVVVDALVSRVITEKDADGATVAKEVEFISCGEFYTVNIGREVVLCAGSVSSDTLPPIRSSGMVQSSQVAADPRAFRHWEERNPQ